VVGTAFAGNAFSGLVGKGPGGAHHDRRGAAGRRRHGRRAGSDPRRGGAVFVPAGQKLGQNTRRAGEDLAAAAWRWPPASAAARPNSG
jgi:molybdopterin molybdotransferase